MDTDVNLIQPLFLGKQRSSVVMTAQSCMVRFCSFFKKATMWLAKFPMLGIDPGINLKASRQNIFKNGQTSEVFCPHEILVEES